MIEHIARRRFLSGVAGATLAIPFLSSIVSPRHGEAQERENARRFVFVFSANGQRPENWHPVVRDWRVVSAADRIREVSLTEGRGAISPVLGDAFGPLRSKLLLLRGLDFVRFDSGSHVVTSPLSGFARGGEGADTGVTIDQVLAASSSMYPAPPPVRSVHMLLKPGFQVPTSVSVARSGGSLRAVPHIESVANLHRTLFGGLASVEDPDAAARTELRGRTLDRVRAQYEALRAHRRLSAADRRTLDAHVEHLHEIEGRLRIRRGSCEVPAAPGDLDTNDESNLALATRDAIDLLVAALRCDLTRVVTLMLSGGTDIRYSRYLPGGGTATDHHTLSHDAHHDPSQSVHLARVNAWYGDQVAHLLSELDATVEDPTSGETVLDRSLVYWGNEDGCNTQDSHWHSNMPVMLAGSVGGRFRTGRYVDYRRAEGPDGSETAEAILFPWEGRPAPLSVTRGRLYNSLLISILDAFDVPPDERGYAPGEGYGDYEGNYQDQYSLEEGRRALPALT